MKLKPKRILIVGFVGALALFGSRLAGAGVPVDPCALLTQSQVTAAFGEAFDAGQKINATACSWSAANAKTRMTIALWAAGAFDKMKTPIAGITKTPTAGVGDDAFYAKVAQFISLTVKKGNVVFIVRIYGVPDADKQMAIEKSLALDIVAKL